MKMERHKFVSYWLWGSVIAGGLSFLFSFIYIKDSLLLFSLSLITSILMSISSVLLLKWKIMGFYIYCIFQFLMIIEHNLTGFFKEYFEGGIAVLISILWCLLGVLIKFGVLHIRKNKVSAWAYLKGNYVNQDMESVPIS